MSKLVRYLITSVILLEILPNTVTTLTIIPIIKPRFIHTVCNYEMTIPVILVVNTSTELC